MLDDVLALTDRELGLLAAGLDRGSIRPDADTAHLAAAGLGGQAGRLHAWLPGALARLGSAGGVAEALRLVLEARRWAAAAAPAPELVLTGPDVDGVDVRDTRVAVRELFEAARRSVLVVGYAFHDCGPIFAPLADRMAARPGLAVRVIPNVHRRRGRSAGPTVEDFARNSGGRAGRTIPGPRPSTRTRRRRGRAVASPGSMPSSSWSTRGTSTSGRPTSPRRHSAATSKQGYGSAASRSGPGWRPTSRDW